MNYKRAFWISILAYLTSLLIGISVLVISGLTLSTVSTISSQMLFATQVVSIIAIGLLFAWWYFRSPRTHASLINGAKLGIVMIVVGFLLDSLLAAPALLSIEGFTFSDVVSIYADPVYWLTLLLLLGATASVGWYLAQARVSTS